MIHQYKLNGYSIVLDVNSGAVHVVDDCSYDILELLPREGEMDKEIPENVVQTLKGKYTEEELRETYEELYALYQAGQLFSSDSYEPFASMMTEAPVKAMCLNIAHDCNLRCEYCFAAKGDFGRGRMLMPLEIGKKAIDFLIERSGSRHNLEVDWKKQTIRNSALRSPPTACCSQMTRLILSIGKCPMWYYLWMDARKSMIG